MLNLLKKHDFPFSSYNPNQVRWQPDCWERNEIDGILYTYQIPPESHENKNNGIRLWTSFDNNKNAGKGSVYQILRLVPEKKYNMIGRFRMEEGSAVGASMFIVPYHINEGDEPNVLDEVIYFATHFPIQITPDGHWYKLEAKLCALFCRDVISKVGVVAGYGAGQFIDIESLSLEETGEKHDVPWPTEKVVDGVVGYLGITPRGNQMSISTNFRNDTGKALKIYSVDLSFQGTDRTFLFFPYSDGWLNSYLPPQSTTKVIRATKEKGNLNGTYTVNGCCFTNEGYVEFAATAYL